MLIDRTDTFIASLGFESYRVGGSVRDEIIGRTPKDADYMIRGVPLIPLGVALKEARPDGDLGPLRLRDGGQFGWRFSAKGIGSIEIALPRGERSTGEGRSMEVYTDPAMPLAEDARRRDFTFNALYRRVGEFMAADVTDPTASGLYDLQHRIVNVTHADSFRDDPLRTLRALRFVSTLDADLGPETRALMALHAEHVTGISRWGFTSGTVKDEFDKLLMGQAPAKALRIARDTGVLAEVMPELAPMLGFDQGSRYHDLPTCEHTFKALETAAHVDAPLRVRWALLFHDSGKPSTAWLGEDGRKHYYAHPPDSNADHEVAGEAIWRAAAERLNVDVRLREDVATLIREHMVPVKTRNAGTRVRRMRVKFGDELVKDLLLHRTCDLSGKGVKVALNHIEHIAKLEHLRREAQEAGVPATRKDLAISGGDIAALGAQGRRIGEIQDRVLDEVVCQPSEQTLSREWQIGRAEALAR